MDEAIGTIVDAIDKAVSGRKHCSCSPVTMVRPQPGTVTSNGSLRAANSYALRRWCSRSSVCHLGQARYPRQSGQRAPAYGRLVPHAAEADGGEVEQKLPLDGLMFGAR